MKELKPEQIKAVGLIVARDVNGLTYEAIAKEVGVTGNTLFTWRHKKVFRDSLNKKAQEVADTYLTLAYKNIADILNDPKARSSDKIKASEIILRNQGKFNSKLEVELQTAPTMQELLDRLDKV